MRGKQVLEKLLPAWRAVVPRENVSDGEFTRFINTNRERIEALLEQWHAAHDRQVEAQSVEHRLKRRRGRRRLDPA